MHLFTPERDIAEMFLFEQKRRVQKDRTVSLRGVVFEVEASLVGQTVSLRFDPSQKIPRVDVYFKGRKIQQAKPVDAYANCFVRRDHATKALEPDNAPDAPAPGLRFSELKRRDEEH